MHLNELRVVEWFFFFFFCHEFSMNVAQHVECKKNWSSLITFLFLINFNMGAQTRICKFELRSLCIYWNSIEAYFTGQYMGAQQFFFL